MQRRARRVGGSPSPGAVRGVLAAAGPSSAGGAGAQPAPSRYRRPRVRGAGPGRRGRGAGGEVGAGEARGMLEERG